MTVAAETMTYASKSTRQGTRATGPTVLAAGSARQIAALLAPVVGIIDKHSQFPVARSVLVRRDGGEVVASATDLETVFSHTATLDGTEAGRASGAIDAVAMLKVLKGLAKDDQVEILVEGSRARLARGASSYDFTAFPEREFPDFARTLPKESDAQGSLTVDATELHRALVAVRDAMAEREVRKYLTGMLLRVHEGTAMVAATNGHWLAKYDLASISNSGTGIEVILPRAGVLELAKATKSFAGPVEISVHAGDQPLVTVGLGALHLTTRPLEGTYPNINKVLDDGKLRAGARLVRAETVAALKRLKPATTPHCQGVSLEMRRDRCGLSVKTYDAACREDVVVAYEGAPIKVGLNLTYLQEAIASIDAEHVILSVAQETGANGYVESTVLIRADEAPSYVGAIMPMRL